MSHLDSVPLAPLIRGGQPPLSFGGIEMLRLAVFIDAGYLWKQLCKSLVPGDEKYRRANVELNYPNFHKELTDYLALTFRGVPLLRCYWYDGSLPGGNLSSDHRKVAVLNDFKLRLGSKITEAADGKIKQKGVDGLIIADLIGLAQNKVISHALLVSGDGDMVPGVGVAQSLGVRIHLLAVHNEAATSPQLIMEADFFESWQLDKISRFAQPRNIPDDLTHLETTIDCSPQPASHISLPETKTKVEIKSPTQYTTPAILAGETVPLADFLDLLTEDEKASITPYRIPYDIDRRLIRFGYENKGLKTLTEDEKRSLRYNLRILSQQK